MLIHDEYVSSRREREPEFAASYDETSAAMALAMGLADLREHRNLSQRALAEKSGIKQPMINRIERGSQVPRTFTLLRLLAVLNGVLPSHWTMATVYTVSYFAQELPIMDEDQHSYPGSFRAFK
jgi:DNA-binding XRE family transcriptional regulator